MKSQYIKCRFLKPTNIIIIIKHTSSEIEFVKYNLYSLSGIVSIFLVHHIITLCQNKLISIVNKCNEFLELKTKDKKFKKNNFMLSNRRGSTVKKQTSFFDLCLAKS